MTLQNYVCDDQQHGFTYSQHYTLPRQAVLTVTGWDSHNLTHQASMSVILFTPGLERGNCLCSSFLPGRHPIIVWETIKPPHTHSELSPKCCQSKMARDIRGQNQVTKNQEKNKTKIEDAQMTPILELSGMSSKIDIKIDF